MLAQYEKIAEQQKQALQQSQTLAQNQINAQKDDVLQNYQNNARQAYINKMLGQKSVGQELSQAGLNTSGVVGSAYDNLENTYGNSLANLQMNRDQSIKDINNQLNDTNLQYAIKQNELMGDIENAKLELQKYGNQLAYQKYQDALNNYMSFTNMDYQKQQDALAQENWLKQYEQALKEFEYKKEQDAIAQQNWLKEFELAQKKTASSSGSSGTVGGVKIDPIDPPSEDEQKVGASQFITDMNNSIATLKNVQNKSDSAQARENATKLIEKMKTTIDSYYEDGVITKEQAYALFEKIG